MSAQTENEEFEFMAMAEAEAKAKAKSLLNTSPIPSQFTNRPTSFSDYANGSPEAAGKPAQDVLHLASNVARIPTQIPNSEIQAVQDAKSVPGLIGHALLNPIKAALDPFRSGPDRIQSPSETLQRMGVGNAPQTIQNAGAMPSMGQFNPNNMPKVGKDVTLPGAADQLGNMYEAAGNYLTGGVASKITPPNVSGAIQSGKLAALKSLEEPATKTILTKLGYNPKLMPQTMPELAQVGDAKSAANIVAQQLKSVDLLHEPELAKVNLQSGIEKYGNAIGKAADIGTQNGVKVPALKMLSDLRDEFYTALNEDGTGAATKKAFEDKVLPAFADIVKNLNPDELGKIPLNKAVKLKQQLQDLQDNFDKNADLSLLQGMAKKASNKMLENIGNADPVYGPKIIELNKPYSQLKTFEPMIQDAYTKKFGDGAIGKNAPDLNIPTSPYQVTHKAVNAGINFTLNPKQLLTNLNEGLAEKAANVNPIEQVSPNLDFSNRAFSPEAQSKFNNLDQPFIQNERTPRFENNSRRPLDPQPITPTYVPIQGSFESPWGKSGPQKAVDPQLEGWDALDPNKRANLPPQGPNGLEGMAPPEMAQARAQAAQDSRDAYTRQDRPIREFTPQAEQPNFKVLTPNELRLSPRVPKGPIQSSNISDLLNPGLNENDKISAVLNNAGRAPIVLNQNKIDALKNLLKQATTKEQKQSILKLMRDENYKIPLQELNQ